MPADVAGSKMLLFCAGNAFDGPPSTDRRLALALAETMPVLWIDPPTSLLTRLRCRGSWRQRGRGLDEPAANLRRLRMLGPPGLTRPLIRTLTAALYRRQVQRAIGRHGEVLGTVLAQPLQTFPLLAGVKVLYVTDDWVSGADLMGLDAGYVHAVLQDNIRTCDVLAAVTEELLSSLRGLGHAESGPRELLLPNGCEPRGSDGDATRPTDVPEGRFALLVGQLNERLDLLVLQALAEREVPVVVVGPRSERSHAARADLDRLFALPSFHYLGPRSSDELAPYLRWASVGLTPYADTAFNRASYPLKTLDYLAAGLTVVSTDLPAARQLASGSVVVAADAADFARLSGIAVRQGRSVSTEAEAVALAEQNSWAARAQALVATLEQHLQPQTIL